MRDGGAILVPVVVKLCMCVGGYGGCEIYSSPAPVPVFCY